MSLRDINYHDKSPLYWTGLSSPVAARALRRALHSDIGIARSGLSANTCVDTLRGPVLARELRIGDQVKTWRFGFARLRWIGTSRGNGPQDAPMRCTLAAGQNHKTVLSADQLVVIDHDRCEQLFGRRQVMSRARHMGSCGHFMPDRTVNPVFVHLLFDAVELVKCGAIWVESLCPDMDHIWANNTKVAEDIVAHLPRLANRQGLAAYLREFPVLNGRETDAVFADI